MNPQTWFDELMRHHASATSFELSVRFMFVVICLGCCATIWHFSTIPVREKNAAAAAGIVHFLMACCIEYVAVGRVYCYQFKDHLLWGMAFDVQVGWAALWGTGLCIAWRTVPSRLKTAWVIAVIVVTLGLDFAALQSGRVFTPLTEKWWLVDLVALAFLATSTLFFYTLILSNRALYFRTIVYGIAYTFVFYVLIPSLILECSQSQHTFTTIFRNPYYLMLALTALPGLMAAIQFATAGEGSPLPLDPTRNFVTDGAYAYVRNPMQISGMLSAIVWALATDSFYMWVYAFDMFVLIQLTRSFEDREMQDRFGDAFEQYCKNVRMWLPRLTPYRSEQVTINQTL